MQIARRFDTSKKANNFYLRLCDKYNSVKLIRQPSFSKSGTYVWEVKEKL